MNESNKECTCQPCWDRSLKISFGIFTAQAGVEDGLMSQDNSDAYIKDLKDTYEYKDGYECINRNTSR
jgi:hypothetical protein